MDDSTHHSIISINWQRGFERKQKERNRRLFYEKNETQRERLPRTLPKRNAKIKKIEKFSFGYCIISLYLAV